MKAVLLSYVCPYQKECVKSGTGYRQVKRYLEYDSYREEMDKKLCSDSGKTIYRQRWKDVEPVFGQMKTTVFKNAPFMVRGLRKVRGEFGLICIVHNIRKITTYLNSEQGKKNRIYDMKFGFAMS